MKGIKNLFSIFTTLSASFLSGLSADTFSPDRLNTFYDVFIAEQQGIINQSLTPGGDTGVIPPPGILGHVPLVITNNTGLEASRLYIIGKGQTLAATNAYFLQPNLTTGVCTLVSGATNNSADPTISVQLSKLPSAGTNSYYLYVPQMISGRFYVSVDKPLFMGTVTTGGIDKINDPSQTTVQDPNYYTLYQDFEFTLDVNFDLFANVSNVDYFSLPMTLGSYTYPSGAPYPTLDDLTVVGYPITSSRNSILTNAKSGLLNDASSPLQWSNLTIPFYSNPYAASAPLTDLRILAAKQSIALGNNGVQFKGAATPQTFFNANYLQSATSGPVAATSYMTHLYDYYNTGGHSLGLTIFPAGNPSVTYTLTSGASNILNLDLTPTNQPPAPDQITVDLSKLSTQALLGGAVGEWVTEDAITPTAADPWQTEIAKILSALFTAGLLPPSSGLSQPIVANEEYFSNYRDFYFSNPTGFTDHGPWYNLYDKVIHSLLIQKNGVGLGYAYDFDDLLTIAGLLHVNIQSNGVLNPDQPYVVLSLGPLDTPIPDPTVDFGPYDLTIGALGSESQPISVIYSTDPSQPPNTTVPVIGAPQNVSGVYNYFQVQFNIDGALLTYQVYPKYQLVLPTTTRYNDVDAQLMNGIEFQAGTDGSTFIFSVPNTHNIHQ